MSDYEVGRGRPPRKNRFKKGLSGNPGGRPKKAKPDILAMLDEPVPVMHKGKEVTMQPGEVALRRMFQKAIKDKQLQAITHLLDKLIKYDALPTSKLRQTCGVVCLPNNMPWRMATMAFREVGFPEEWTEANLAKVREEYLASRSDEDAALDDLMGYFKS